MDRSGGAQSTRDRQVVTLRLESAHEMFEMPQSDLFSEYRNFLTGVDFCISELRSRRSRRPVRLVIELPAEALEDGLEARLSQTLKRYCDHRLTYNSRERSALRLDGVTALRIGLPITAFGLVLTAVAAKVDSDEALKLAEDHLGWVFAWIGLWYPLDVLFFYGHPYGRESGVLRILRDAEIVLRSQTRSEVGTD